ncbi:5-oxoprolinase subunit PxpB [SAR202 cluster bacterium AD-802-E10_MRT_200m]|nr:5-oxoprolinase subunit PxpB [SAR202 cluster bacterium AD-802-E10_MRT_200m]
MAFPAGDSAVTFEVGHGISPEIQQRVQAFTVALEREPIYGIDEVFPTYRSLFIIYNPLILSFSDLERILRDLEFNLDAMPSIPKRIVEIPTVYGGDGGPDLEFVAENAGLSTDEVVKLHAGTDYLVYMMGFSPGFTYLGGLHKAIATPRLTTPRVSVPTGSVGIAGSQTGVYPSESPGGWQLIGRTPVPLFNSVQIPPTIVEPGEYLRFVSITNEECAEIVKRIRNGTFQITECFS